MNDLHLLPYLRRGLVRHVEGADPGAGSIGPASTAASVVVAGQDVSATVNLLGPHHVAALNAVEILRRYPAPNATEVEPNYFPLIELSAPDLPWRMTPAAPGSKSRLRPWLALVVVPAGMDGIDYSAGSGGGRLTVEPNRIHELPPIDEIWAWTHVQSIAAPADVPATIDTAPAGIRARLLCPRRMEPGTRYRAALVNAFKEGIDGRSDPAWGDGSSGAVTLTVFDTWTFTTSTEIVNFELLCERLVPDTAGGALGVRAVDVSKPGLDVNWPQRRKSVRLVGPLADVSVIGPSRDDTRPFTDVVVPILNESLSRGQDPPIPADYDALRDDPVVGLPFYGSWPAAVPTVPRTGWPRELNVEITARIAAGLGAKTVRRNQESLMASAWDQLGEVREVSDELNRGRLSAEVGRTWQARLAAVDSGDRLALAAPLLTFVRVGNRPAREVARASLAPDAIIERAWLRRPPRPRAASASRAFVRGTRSDATPRDRLAFGYQVVAKPVGIKGIDTELEVGAIAGVLSAAQIDWVAGSALLDRLGGTRLGRFARGEWILDGRPPGRRRDRAPARRASLPRPAVTAVAAAVASMNPLQATRADLVSRMPALGGLLPAGELPAALALAPRFTDALFWDLAALDPDVIVPGLDGFTNNRVRLLAVNGAFVAAYLAGANHELAREFVWREYPADLAATFFARFFDYTDPDAVDIPPIAGWPGNSSLAANAVTSASSTVLLIRADLVRRYPDVSIFLTPQAGGGDADYGRAVYPSFEGRLADDTLVVGFPVEPDVVLGEKGPEYFAVFEERVTAPRFGLDIARRGPLTSWDELAWTDFPDDEATHIGPGPIGALGVPEFNRVVWGRNAAHMAAAVHRPPFRRLYPAGHLIRRDGGSGDPRPRTGGVR